MTSTLFIENVSGVCSISDIEKKFLPFGEIFDIRIATSPKVCQSQQYGFVEYKFIRSAQKAFSSLNGNDLCGFTMR